MTSLAPLRQVLAAYNPRFARANLSPVQRWMSEGADLDFDILPVIRFWTARKKDIFSLGFFTPYVLAARDARIKRQILTPRQRAEKIALLTRWLGQRLPTDERWLAEYERANGRVEPPPRPEPKTI